MQVLATINPLTFPGADHVSPQGPDGYAVYGPEKDGVHRAIALLRVTAGGKYLVEAQPAVLSALGPTTPVTAAEALAAWPIYKTIVKVVKRGWPNSIAAHIGSQPKGTTFAGRKILSTKPAAGWTMKKMLDMEYQIAKPTIEEELSEP